jgi:hypothetical protein
MRQVNDKVLSGLDAVSINGKQIDTNQMINMSFHCILSDATAAGSFSLQASNDISQIPPGQGSFTATNWVDIPNATVTMTAGTQQALIMLSELSFRWVRAVWTQTTPGTGTVVVNRFGQGV